MSFQILIVEDELLYADQLEMLIDKMDYDHLATVDNSEDALNAIEQRTPDLILMDVHIQGEHDGIELAGLIQAKQNIPIIFITSLRDDLTFARASRTNPQNFLVKPFNELQLQRTIELTVKQLNKQETNKEEEKVGKEENWDEDFLFQSHFFIKTRQRLIKIATEDLLYLEADGHYCQVHTAEKKFLVRISLTELSERLPKDSFIQTHRSFLVNLNKVDSVDLQDNTLLLGKKHAPLSKRNKEEVLKKLNWI